MKLIKSNGRRLEVRDVGEVVYELISNGVPIKLSGTILMTDDEARVLVRELIAAQKQSQPQQQKDDEDV